MPGARLIAGRRIGAAVSVAVLATLFASAVAVRADVTVTGSYGPVVSGGPPDPWEVHTFVIAGQSEGAPGTLTISNGGSVTSGISGGAYGGYYRDGVGFSASGLVVVDGQGSSLHSAGLHMGNGDTGYGELRVLNGAQVEIGEFVTGIGGGEASILVRGEGSKLALPVSTTFGWSTGSQVEALVDQGGALETAQIDIGFFSPFGFGFDGAGSSHGSLTVDGEGSTYAYNQTAIGRGAFSSTDGTGIGDGMVTISNGAVATATTGPYTIAVAIGFQYASGELLVTGEGSQWLNTDGIIFRLGGTGATGLVRIEDGGYIDAGANVDVRAGSEMRLDAGSLKATTFTLNGSLTGSGSIETALTNVAGSVSPGMSAGLLELTGDYEQQAGGSMLMELAGDGGVAGVDFDQLLIHGSADLAGTLQVSTLNGYLPTNNVMFDLIVADDITDSDLSIVSDLSLSLAIVDLPGGGEALRLTAIPEPTSWLLLGGGAMVVLARRRVG